MALLRKSIRPWIRSLRLCSTEPRARSTNPMKLMKHGGRAVPSMLISRGNFALCEWLRDDRDLTQQHWIDARKEFLTTSEFRITEATVDMIIVNLCLDSSKIQQAMSYLQHLWDSGSDMNLLSMMTYLKLCYVRKDGTLTKTELDYLHKMYDAIRTKYPLLNSSTAEHCVMGISKTERWRDSFELLDMIKIMERPRSASYTAIIRAAFDNNEPEIGWKYLNETLQHQNPDHTAYLAYLDYCTRNFEGPEMADEIGKMFDFWGDHDVRAYIDVIAAYEKVLVTLGWTAKHTWIKDNGGVCQSCNSKLRDLEVTQEQFALLASTVQNRVIVGDDVYRRTTPEELKMFLRLVERSQPYDIVIDGLNVSYVANKSKAKPDGAVLTDIFKTCLKMGKQILVLGRKHMRRWPRLDLDFMKQQGHVFLANDTSQDDPYLLFATLRSGPKTKFISNDLMRQHKYLLEDEKLKKTFKYWQLAHQCRVSTFKDARGRINVNEPPTYVPLAQRDVAGFHVPYNTNPALQPPLIYEPPRSWVCFRKPYSSSKRTPIKS